jgi:hypothetical protein
MEQNARKTKRTVNLEFASPCSTLQTYRNRLILSLTGQKHRSIRERLQFETIAISRNTYKWFSSTANTDKRINRNGLVRLQ